MFKCPRCGYIKSEQRNERSERSEPQNRYYWGCVIQVLSDETGYTKDEIHEMMKHKFLSSISTVSSKAGKKVFAKITKRTTEITTKEFEDYLAAIRAWASAELSIYIPHPHESLESFNI